MEDGECDSKFWKATYIWGIISWQTRLFLPAGVRWLTGSRMNVMLYLIWTHSPLLLWWISSLGAILKSVLAVFHPAHRNEWEQIRSDTFSDVDYEQTPGGRGSTRMTGTNFKPFSLLNRTRSSVSASSLLGGSGCSCDGCAPACKNTDFGGPPWSRSQRHQSYFSSKQHKPPTGFR